jgi:hypothetical protein
MLDHRYQPTLVLCFTASEIHVEIFTRPPPCNTGMCVMHGYPSTNFPQAFSEDCKLWSVFMSYYVLASIPADHF